MGWQHGGDFRQKFINESARQWFGAVDAQELISLVRNSARRRGIGATLMAAAEAEARRLNKTLLVLDTASPEAERLYERSGWVRVGVIPGYALLPDGRPCDTAYYYKALA